jgi:metal-dependent HD superfamily phosphatase/phosphodiesterase
MLQQQLFCVAGDGHRAVVLSGYLADLGNPVERSDHPENPRLGATLCQTCVALALQKPRLPGCRGCHLR